MTPAARDDARNLAAAAATQHTLNRALGSLGGRQKSWMNPNQPSTSTVYPPFPTESRIASSTARPEQQSSAPAQSTTPTHDSIPPPLIVPRPRGRPRKYPLPSSLDPPPSPQERTAVQLSREIYPPSNSTSPQLANIVSSGLAHPLPPTNTVLPSPSPSPDTTTESNNIDSAYASATSNNDYARASHTIDQGATSPQYHVFDRAHQTAQLRQAEAASKRRPDTSEIRTMKRSRVQLQTRQDEPQSALLAQLQSEGQRRSSSGQVSTRPPSTNQAQSCSSSTNQSSFNYPSPYQFQQGTQDQAEAGITPPQVQAPFGPARALSTGHGQQSYGPPAGTYVGTFQPHSPVVSSPLATAEYFTQKDCNQVLNHFYQTHYSHQGGSMPQSHDEQRLKVLKEAVQRQDWDYLTMHQNYCLLSTDPQSLPTTILNHASRKAATALLALGLGTNEKLSPAVLAFFTNFPTSIHQLVLKWPVMCHIQEQRFLCFMDSSAKFEVVKNACVQRKFPPIVREFGQDLGIASFTFQRLVFTAILRHIWATSYAPPKLQHKFEDEALSILNQNQQNLWRMSSSNTVPSDDDDQHWSLSQQQHVRPVLPSNHAQSSTLDHRQPQTAQAAIARGRGPPRMSPHNQSHVTTPSIQRQAAQRKQNRLFFPVTGYTQMQQREPNPTRFGLHHAYLRSPVLKAERSGPALYQYVKAFAKGPARFKDAGEKVLRWSLPVKNMVTIPRRVPGLAGEPGLRVVNTESNLMRLRCIKWLSSKTENPTEHTWAISDTHWPPNTYFTFNETPLHPRKKLYHGKDLSIDISNLIREGDNSLDIAVLRQSNDQKYLDYVLAIEVVGFEDHDAIKQACLTSNHIPACETLEAIKRKLSGADDDDEIAIVASNLTIQLFDPFSASRICDIPARTRTCLHFDCFDLETFLQTRPRKGDSSVVDQWRCPICSEDARPQHLVVDGFLEEVRKQLEHSGLLETRAIIMNQDGSWQPRVEAIDPNGVRDQSEEDDRPVAHGILPVQAQKAPIEFIDLSD